MTQRHLVCIALLICLLCGCKKIPANRYGIDRVEVLGTDKLDDQALKACLASQERERVTINLGASGEPECGVPPFDGKRLAIRLWRWPWKRWPTLDLSVFERDLRRIERWYQARGYYDAKVTAVGFEPDAASHSDQISDAPPKQICSDSDAKNGCPVSLTVTVHEGKAINTKSIEVTGAPRKRKKELRKAVELEIGEPFDEALYDRSKRAMQRKLEDEGFACAAISGEVIIDPKTRSAQARFDVDPGPISTLRSISVHGAEDLNLKTIRAVSQLESGDRFSSSELADAQRAIYALGAFASVDVVSIPIKDEMGVCTSEVDVEIRVEPGRKIRYGVGVGLQSGTIQTIIQDQDALISDFHLFLLFEHRNFLGNFRKLRIEDRPKFIVRDPLFRFVRAGLQFGNEIKVSFRQPSFIEARTVLGVDVRHDYGLDPNDLFLRHDLEAGISLSRSFFNGVFHVTGGINWNEYLIIDRNNPNFPTDYRLLFFNQLIQLDLRDDSREPRKGFFAELGLQESAIRLKKSWQYIRTTPEVRGFIPLPLSSTIALRFGVGAMFIINSDSSLDPVSQRLGPQSYRLRSGGPTSHRGFVAGYLGDLRKPSDPIFDQNDGGLRRWEGSLEWRVPVTPSFGAALFSDVGDVNREKEFRFSHLHLAVGFGFRYRTPVGPLRFDAGFLVPKAQILGQEPPPATFKIFGRVPGAFHVTIGEAF